MGQPSGCPYSGVMSDKTYDDIEYARLTEEYGREVGGIAFIYGEESYEVLSRTGNLTVEVLVECESAMMGNAIRADGTERFQLLCRVHDEFVNKHRDMLPKMNSFNVCEVW